VESEGSTPTTLTLTPYERHGHKAVSVVIDGTSTPFLFDTGGGISLITPETAKQIGCAPFGNLVGYRMRGERVDFQRCDDIPLTIDGLTVRHDTVGVFDLNALLPPKWPRVGGMVTLASFEHSQVSVDLGAGRVDVSDDNLPKSDSSPLKLVRQASGFSLVVLVPVETSRGTLWLELDSGSSAPLLLAPHAADLLGASKDHAVATKTDGKGAASQAEPFDVTLDLPNVGPVDTSAKVVDMIYDGNIGAPLMARFRWRLDLDGARVRVEATHD
jgi:hypothetical protein